MSDKSKIDWTDATYNPIVGCSKISEGCVNCYAEKMAGRLAKMQVAQYMRATLWTHCAGPDPDKEGWRYDGWTGKGILVESVLDKPLHWRKPRKIFVCSMGDLFHESVPFEWIDRVMAVIALCPQHTGQILTKRVDRMAEYFSQKYVHDGVTLDTHRSWGAMLDKLRELDKTNDPRAKRGTWQRGWPLPNLHIGVTVENSNHLSRITMLGNIRAAVHFVSFEPLLGPINMFAAPGWQQDIDQPFRDTVQWVIVGPETGPSARPCDNDWIRRIVKDCERAGVACFVKKIVGPDGKAIHPGPEWPREFPEVKA